MHVAINTMSAAVAVACGLCELESSIGYQLCPRCSRHHVMSAYIHLHNSYAQRYASRSRRRRDFYLRGRNNNSPRLPPPSSPVSGWLAPLLLLLVIPRLANHRRVSHLIGGFPDPTLLISSFQSSPPPSSPVPHRPSLLAPRFSSFHRATLPLHTPRASLSDLRSLDDFDL